MEYIKNNAVLRCSCGTFPALLTVTSNSKIKNREGLFATNKDNLGGVNITTFGACAVNLVCIIAGVKMTWINTAPKVTVLGNKTLLDGVSKLICPKGGIISCLSSGQM